ncbi:MAG: ImmA/IrrE family metallo-endopeptidase [Candidatus Schekmanbacteria bacterium]|nr:ImmA/IrrE family metallo-endopeptidase [Candidatus Schekmanbacteria bacterium]
MTYTEVPHYTYNDIKKRAYEFLATYHPSLEIPVPIEEILEFQFNINIIPLPGLHEGYDIDGFISSDLTTINIDEFVYQSRLRRYRFTLAHEAGHIILHKKFFKENVFSSVREWKKFTQSIEDRDYSFLEWHANTFAGLVLVFPSILSKLFYESVETAKNAGFSFKNSLDIIQDYIASDLAKKFSVSSEVIRRRLEKDNLLVKLK